MGVFLLIKMLVVNFNSLMSTDFSPFCAYISYQNLSFLILDYLPHLTPPNYPLSLIYKAFSQSWSFSLSSFLIA